MTIFEQNGLKSGPLSPGNFGTAGPIWVPLIAFCSEKYVLQMRTGLERIRKFWKIFEILKTDNGYQKNVFLVIECRYFQVSIFNIKKDTALQSGTYPDYWICLPRPDLTRLTNFWQYVFFLCLKIYQIKGNKNKKETIVAYGHLLR
jgi:hypothetical protein